MPRSTVGPEAVTGRPDGGWAARPSAPSGRRTASGSVTVSTIRERGTGRERHRPPGLTCPATPRSPCGEDSGTG